MRIMAKDRDLVDLCCRGDFASADPVKSILREEFSRGGQYRSPAPLREMFLIPVIEFSAVLLFGVLSIEPQASLCLRSQRFELAFINFDCNALHNKIYGENNSKAAFSPLQHPFHSAKSSRTNANSLPDCEQGVRLRITKVQAGSKAIYFCVRKWGGFTPCAIHNRMHTGHFRIRTRCLHAK